MLYLILAMLAAPYSRDASVPSLLGRAYAASPTVDELLASVDRNLTFDTRAVTVTMKVTKNGREKVYEMRSWGKGSDQAAVEYLAPARDKGTKMLKVGPELWMYLPSVERTQKISGHMLRQGMMGSDMSYEDMMQASAWKAQYKGTVTGAEELEGRSCWKVELNAVTPDVSYPRRVVWVDQQTRIPLRQELFAVSGMLLKVWTMSDPVEVAGRRFPSRMVIEDKVQKGSKTELTFRDLQFAVPLEAEVFSQRWLER